MIEQVQRKQRSFLRVSAEEGRYPESTAIRVKSEGFGQIEIWRKDLAGELHSTSREENERDKG